MPAAPHFGRICAEHERAGDDPVGAGGLKQRDALEADAPVDLDLGGQAPPVDETAGSPDLVGSSSIEGSPLDADLRAEDRDDVQFFQVGLELFHLFFDPDRDAHEFAAVLDGVNRSGQIVGRVKTDDEAIRAGIRKGSDPGQRVRGHQVNLERNRGVFTDRRDQVREEQQRGHVMAVGDVEMEPLGVGFNAADLASQVRQVRGPQGGRAF